MGELEFVAECGQLFDGSVYRYLIARRQPAELVEGLCMEDYFHETALL